MKEWGEGEREGGIFPHSSKNPSYRFPLQVI